jgi:hypothetical protein
VVILSHIAVVVVIVNHTSVETVVSVLHHGEIGVTEHADLEQLAKGGVYDEVGVVLDAELEEFKCLLAVVFERCLNLDVSLYAVLLQLVLE